MDNKYYSLDKAVKFFKKRPISKVIASPVRIAYPLFLQLISSIFKKPIFVKGKTFWGDKIMIAIPELVSFSLLRYRFFEEGLTRIVLNYLKPGMVFFDIGAHFGYFSLLASRIVGDSGRVHSFEPTPSSFNILKANTINRKNITINNCGVFSEEKEIIFNDFGLKYSAFNSIFEPRIANIASQDFGKNIYKIRCISIDNYVDKRNIVPNFIKIDAESSEYEIILGMEKTIKTHSPLISVEVGDMEVLNGHGTIDIINYLSGKHYRPYIFDKGEIAIWDYANMGEPFKYDNILFMPE